MKRNTLIASIILIVIGFIVARVGDNVSSLTANGVVQDSFLMPIGAILFALGLLGLVVASLWYLIAFVGGRLKKDQA